MRIYLAFIFTFLANAAFSQNGDKIITEKGVKYLVHTVEPKETLYRISKTYGVAVSEIKKLNPALATGELKADSEIKLPYRESVYVYPTGGEKAAASKPKTADKSADKAISKPKAEKVAETPSTVSTSASEKARAGKELGKGDDFPTSTKVDPNAKSHTVLKGETLFRISKMYNVKVEDLVRFNDLDGYGVQEGQEILLKDQGKGKSLVDKAISKVKDDKPETKPIDTKPITKPVVDKEPVKEVAKTNPVKTETKMSRYMQKYMELAADSKNQEKEVEQVLRWVEDSGKAKPAGWYAIHKTLPVGTYLKIVNPINGASAYAKVIQNLSETPENKGVDFVLPKTAAQSDLKIFDDVFRVKVYYVEPK